MRILAGSQREAFGEVADLVSSLRVSCGASCLLYAFFDMSSRELIEIQLSSVDGFSEDERKALLRSAAARAAVLSALQPDPRANGQKSGRSAIDQDSFPIWTAERGMVFGAGKPLAGYLPVIALTRDASDLPEETKALLRFALGYVSKALTEFVYSKPIWPDGLAATTLRLLSIGFLIVNRLGEVEVDGRETDQGSHDFLTVSHNRLSTPDAKERAALAEAIRLAASEARQTSVVSLSTENAQLKMVLVAPFEKSQSELALILFETGGADHFALRDHFFRAHAITRSEALVAHEVLNGRSTAEAATATGLSLETVRSYLKQVFCKTGTHRQSELISLYYSWTLPVGKSIASAELRRRH